VRIWADYLHRYLAADKFGILSALRDAISAEEQFVCVAASPDSPKGMLALQTAREKFVGMDPESKAPEVRADAEAITFATTVRVRMQARFKPKLQASRESKAREKISRKELEDAVGRRLEEDEVKRLKRARRDGSYHEALLDVKVKGKHDKFA
jgi:protein FRG1